ncbi:hypothetical protein ACI2KR_31045 [Pseudomonas luteola]
MQNPALLRVSRKIAADLTSVNGVNSSDSEYARVLHIVDKHLAGLVSAEEHEKALASNQALQCKLADACDVLARIRQSLVKGPETASSIQLSNPSGHDLPLLLERLDSVLDTNSTQHSVEGRADWIDANVTGHPTLIQAMKNIAGCKLDD